MKSSLATMGLRYGSILYDIFRLAVGDEGSHYKVEGDVWLYI